MNKCKNKKKLYCKHNFLCQQIKLAPKFLMTFAVTLINALEKLLVTQDCCDLVICAYPETEAWQFPDRPRAFIMVTVIVFVTCWNITRIKHSKTILMADTIRTIVGSRPNIFLNFYWKVLVTPNVAEML